jgi:predicted DCC family thiol-disulfide oxidoreductase YuxK
MQLHDSHAPDVASRFPELANADLENAMFAIDRRGRLFRGYFAFRRLFRALPLAWPLLPLFYVPGASALGPRLYARIARSRGRLGCATDACPRGDLDSAGIPPAR